MITIAHQIVGKSIFIGTFARDVAVRPSEHFSQKACDDLQFRVFLGSNPSEVGSSFRQDVLCYKGDLLFVVDPSDYRIAVSDAQAEVEDAKDRMTLSLSEAERRARLNELAVSIEQKQIYAVGAATATTSYHQALTRLAKAELNLSRTEVHSPVDGWVTNLALRQGDYSVVGQRALSLVDAHSFWVDGYFEETTIGPIADGDPASVWLMGFPQEIKGHVDSLTRAINVPNAQPNAAGVADVNPVFTWVRLAQRVPVRIHLGNCSRPHSGRSWNWAGVGVAEKV